MKVAIASGKGGTGKTTVSASLATLWRGPLVAVDLDVEEPNLHLFLKPEIQGEEKAYMEVPAGCASGGDRRDRLFPRVFRGRIPDWRHHRRQRRVLSSPIIIIYINRLKTFILTLLTLHL